MKRDTKGFAIRCNGNPARSEGSSRSSFYSRRDSVLCDLRRERRMPCSVGLMPGVGAALALAAAAARDRPAGVGVSPAAWELRCLLAERVTARLAWPSGVRSLSAGLESCATSGEAAGPVGSARAGLGT